jgi:hypothetical protein
MDEIAIAELDAAIDAMAQPENVRMQRMTRYELSIYNYTEAYELSEDMCNALMEPVNVIGDQELQVEPAPSDAPSKSRKRRFIEKNFPGIWGSTDVDDMEFIIKATSLFHCDRTIQRLRIGKRASAELLVLELKRDKPLPQTPSVLLRCLDLTAGDDLLLVVAGAAYHK